MKFLSLLNIGSVLSLSVSLKTFIYYSFDGDDGGIGGSSNIRLLCSIADIKVGVDKGVCLFTL